jgi:uncharacterized protein (TIRG00374 family)
VKDGSTDPTGVVAERRRPGRWARFWRLWRRYWPYIRYVIGLGLAFLAFVAVFGKRGELSGAAKFLGDLDWPWLVLGVVAEAGAITSFALLQGRLLESGRVKVGPGALVSITLAGNSINNSLPAGAAFATVYAFRQYRFRGADDELAGWTVFATALAAAVTLAAFASLGLAIAGAEGASLNLVWVTLFTLVVLVALGGVVLLVLRRRDLLTKALALGVRAAQRLSWGRGEDPLEVATGIRRRLTAVTPSRWELVQVHGWALGNWVLDCACLAAAFAAVGAPVPWRGLVLAYGAGQLAANLPITPGGLGVVEGSLTIALVAYGGAEATTVAAVLVYRIINFWISLPVGWLAAGALAVQRRLRVKGAEGMEPEAAVAL